jgi:hypothetical protein
MVEVLLIQFNGFSMASNRTFGSSAVDVFSDQLTINNYYLDPVE